MIRKKRETASGNVRSHDQRSVAVALAYSSQTDAAPRMTAKGQGAIADKIIALARAYHIPIHHDPALARMVYQVPLQSQIPASLYDVVAEVLAWVYSLEHHTTNKQTKNRGGSYE